MPPGNSSSPRYASSPGSRHSGCDRGVPSTRPSAVRVDSSMRRIAVVPAGTIAPVAISTVLPSASSGDAVCPASTRPTTCHGPAPRTAQPSTLEVGNAGRSVRVVSGSARVCPSVSASGRATAGSAAERPTAYTRERASSHPAGGGVPTSAPVVWVSVLIRRA